MAESLKLCLMTLFHPLVVTEHIKRERGRKMNWTPVIVLLLLALAVRIFSIYVTHYPLSGVSVRKANMLLECGKLFVPVLTWVLASYMMTTILDGETLFTETLLFSSYALTPYIVFTPILNIASRLMDGNQMGLYATLEIGILAWVVLLMILALKEMNGYSVGKTFVMILLTLFTMVMIWAMVILLYTIASQFVTMIKEVFYEVIYRID
ncbi:MAG: YIP1 family protein [Clostridia bacterium]|nr:YIP1 family protein [Clostridia bacterium]